MEDAGEASVEAGMGFGRGLLNPRHVWSARWTRPRSVSK
jgi:hypothetical protein